MKQKVVIKVSMKDSKCRTKALKTAVSVPGVISAELQGPDKDQVVVTGEGIDATNLTVLIRKKVGYSELVIVTPVDEEKKDTEIETVMNPFIFTPYQYPPYQYGTPHIYEVRDGSHEPSCTIM